MNGPYDYDVATLEKMIIDTKSGNYALGYLDSENNFIIEYVGKSDSDVRGRLKEHLPSEHKMFKFCYAISRKVSYLKEVSEVRNYYKSKAYNNHEREICVAVGAK
jgi:hypothetical protein